MFTFIKALLLFTLALLPCVYSKAVEIGFSKGAFIALSARQLIRNTNVSNFRLEVEFKTIHPNGVLYYSEGKHDGYVAIILRSCSMRIVVSSASSGSTLDITLYNRTSLCDGKWHIIKLTQNVKSRINVNLDGYKYRYQMQNIPNINKNTYIAGINYTKLFVFQDIYKYPGFVGCLSKVSIIGKNYLLKRHNKNLKLSSMIKSGCSHSDTVNILGFTKRTDFLKVSTFSKVLKIGFSFRTYVSYGKLFQTQAGNAEQLLMALEDGKLHFNVHIVNKAVNQEFPFVIKDHLTDGNWHDITLTLQQGKGFRLTVDKQVIRWIDPTAFKSAIAFVFKNIWFGDGHFGTGFVGCMNNIMINDNHFKKACSITTEGVKFGTCPVRDHCLHKPCQHGGKCVNNGTSFTCSCKELMYFGQRCTFPLYRSTCHEYKKLGLTTNSKCMIDPDQNGPLMAFRVTCNISRNLITPVQIVLSDIQVHQLNDGFQYHGFFHSYNATILQMKALINRSKKCRQYLYVYVNPSKKGGTTGLNMAQWISANGKAELVPYKGPGYLTGKKLLPVVGIQFKSHLLYDLGPLECYGTSKPSYPLLPKLNTLKVLQDVCKPVSKHDDKNTKDTKLDQETGAYGSKDKDDVKKDIEKDTTSMNPITIAAWKTQIVKIVPTVHVATSPKIASTSPKTQQHLPVTTTMEPVDSKVSASGGFLLWYIAIIVVAVFLFLLLMFCILLIKVQRYTKRQQTRNVTTTARSSITEAGVPLESDLWMTVNAAGYDVKTGTITYGEMYGSFK